MYCTWELVYHVPESCLAVHEDLFQRMRHLGQGEVHMLEATETRLQHTSKFLADLSWKGFPYGKDKSTTSKEAHSNMLISDMPGQRYLRLPHTSTRQSTLSMLRQTRMLKNHNSFKTKCSSHFSPRCIHTGWKTGLKISRDSPFKGTVGKKQGGSKVVPIDIQYIASVFVR